jgi:S1-C subfamily serine protease
MTEHIRRIAIVVAIFTGATLIFQKWRENHGGYGLFDLAAEKPAAERAGAENSVAAGGVLKDSDVPGLAKTSEESAKLSAAVMPSIVRVDVGKSAIVEKRDIFGFLREIRPEIVPAGLGSGVIVSKEGHIVTNLHVINFQGAQQVRVTTSDRKAHDAKLVGYDKDLDIAVLQITDGGQYQALSFADSEKVRVGELAFAFGCPFGLEFTVSRGIVSATQRRFTEAGNDYIQTDTVINRGNSGGPLVNYRGEIVGINVSIYQEDRNVSTWQGVGLAIPANDAKEAYEVITGQRVRAEGYLGADVEMISISDRSRRVFGGRVTGVSPNSPAEKAGLQEGDIIAQFNGSVFLNANQLRNMIRGAKAGQTVTLIVLRDEQEIVIKVQIQPRPAAP